MGVVRLVVGNGYSLFAENSQVWTVGELMENASLLARDDVVVAGQGLSHSERRRLAELVSESSDGVRLVGCAIPCAPKFTHKKVVENVLVGELARSVSGEYTCALVGDNVEDRLVDHVTGQHLNGMLLIEAARQAGIAAIELEYNAGKNERTWSLAWSRCDTRFLSYAFPVPTTVGLALPKVRHAGESQVPLEFTVKFSQAGAVVAEVFMGVTLVLPRLAERLEGRGARNAVRASLKHAQRDAGAEPPVAAAAQLHVRGQSTDRVSTVVKALNGPEDQDSELKQPA